MRVAAYLDMATSCIQLAVTPPPWQGARCDARRASHAIAPAVVAAMLIATGCRRPVDGAVSPEHGNPLGERHDTRPTTLGNASDATRPALPRRPVFDRPAMVRFHMQRHFDDLRALERQLVAGKLDDARALAYLLARPSQDPGFAPWEAESKRMVDAALALAAAPNLAAACRREPRVSEACANCHLHTQLPVFGAPPPLLLNLPTREARMARHQWAIDRLWEAMVGPSDGPWRAGLEVLAETPLPFTPLTGAPKLARHLQELARTQLAALAQGTTLANRAVAYGELLVTCAACHSALGPASR